MDAPNGTSWDAWLLDKDRIDALHAKGEKLSPRSHKFILGFAILGPIRVEGPGDSDRARRACFKVLKRQSWWPKGTTQNRFLRYIHVVRLTSQKHPNRADIVDLLVLAAFEAAKTHTIEKEVLLV